MSFVDYDCCVVLNARFCTRRPGGLHKLSGIPLKSPQKHCLASLYLLSHWACENLEAVVGRVVRDLGALFLTLAVMLPVAVDGQGSTVLVVTGSSMPEPLYTLWNEEYHKQQPTVQVRYLPEGSGQGATRVLTGAGDFAGGDAPIPEKDLKGATTRVVELPTVLIGIVVVYNLPGTTGELHLSGPVLASIYLGKITAWNDPALVKLNPDTKLPSIPIQVLHRSPGKGS